MFLTDMSQQKELFAFSHQELLPKDCDVWRFIQLFDSFDYVDFERAYSKKGQKAIEPRLMLRTIFYGFIKGIFSGRKLQDACRYDNRFIVLIGLQRPDRRTLDRFVSRHQSAISKFFSQVVETAISLNLVDFKDIAVDGSKFKAPVNDAVIFGNIDSTLKSELRKLEELSSKASISSNCSNIVKKISAKKSRIRAISTLKDETINDFESKVIKKGKKSQRIPKSRRALYDKDALSLSTKRGFMLGYNAQAAVDKKHQIVVAGHIHSKSTDYGALEKLLDDIDLLSHERNYRILADRGYRSIKNFSLLAQRGIESVIPVANSNTDPNQSECNEQIHKNPSSDRSYDCIEGKPLDLMTRTKAGKLIFRGNNNMCSQCDETKCLLKGKKRFEVYDDEPRSIYLMQLNKHRSKAFDKIYGQRKAIVEPVFANIKNKGLRITRRGINKVQTWWKLMITAHNIEKILNQRFRNCSYFLTIYSVFSRECTPGSILMPYGMKTQPIPDLIQR